MSVSLFHCHGSTNVMVQASVLSCDTAANAEWLDYCCYLNGLWLKGKYSCGKWELALHCMLPCGSWGVCMSNLQQRSKANMSQQQHHSSELELLMSILLTPFNCTQYVRNRFIQSSLEPQHPKAVWYVYEYDCRTPWTQIEAPQQVIFSNNPLDFLTAIKDSYNTSKRRNTWSTQFSHTRNALQLPERAVNCPPLQVDRALKTHNITKQLHNVTCPRQHIHQFYLAMSLFYLAFADHFACWQLLSSLKVSQDLIDVLFVMQISMVPTTKTNSCNTDLFLETWLYCLSNPSQVEDVRNCAKYVEKKCLQSNLLKDKTGCELQRMEKIWKKVYLFQYLSEAAHLPMLNCCFFWGLWWSLTMHTSKSPHFTLPHFRGSLL